ncbi:MAG TPA: glycosyltransferase family 1 protein [Bacteroidales bacterium]|jgi:glycosyltransferase involved in cell wall biosynthesis|nr:glycosyltransferase family 1 protein [Bacteroidales bacterium]MDD4234483.1 glycosyltransferase family 1 protein [Bacteroidales bacterium]HXK80646.1 glycosyltransferase family 1 protein [Bacteroidales bacterium]
MRIGFDAKRAFFNNSGLGNYSRNTINMLAKIYPNEEYFLYSPKFPEEIPEFARNKTIIGPNSNSNIRNSIWRSVLSGNRIKKDKLDIYHGLSNELPINLNRKQIPSVVTIHDLIFLRYPELFNTTDVKIYTYKFKHACKSADKIIAVSKQTKADIIRYFNIPQAKIHVIYQDCNKIFHEKPNREICSEVLKKYKLPNNYILNVGTIEKRKNAMLILKAMALYNIDIPLVIVGKPTPYLNTLISYAHHYKLKDKLVLLYDVKDEDLPTIYHKASVFVYPSLFEGFGIPILEALNSGVPVITSNLSSLPEVAGTNSILIDPVAHDHLGKELFNLLNNNTKKQEMIEAGYKHALKFRPEVLAPQLMQLYKSIV